MASRNMTLKEMIYGGIGLTRYLLDGGLVNVNLEVTKRCNARCDFCDYWKEPGERELEDYIPIIRRLRPLSVSITGGEPLLRSDLTRLIFSIRRSFGFIYIGLITNGALLTVDKGMELWNAGLDELSISLDYLDERHDRERGLQGLTRHILETAPVLARMGVNVTFNTVIKRENFRDLPNLVRYAGEQGIKLSFSTYNGWRVGNFIHTIPPDELDALREVLDRLKHLRRRYGNVVTSEYYLDRVPEFFSNGGIPGCTAGLNWLQVTPQGYIKRCSDSPIKCHWSQWHPGIFKPTECTKCWYSCRGAAQEPFTLKRFVEMVKCAFC